MSSRFDELFHLGTNYLYITRTQTLASVTINSAGRWDGTAGALEMVGTGVDTYKGISIMHTKNNDIYVGGSQSGYISKYDGTSWSSINSGQFTSNVTTLIYDSTNDLVYAGSHNSATLQNKISIWDGSSWTGIVTGTGSPSFINHYQNFAIDSDDNFYMAFSNRLYKYEYGTPGTWTELSTSLVSTVKGMKYNEATNSIFFASSSNTTIFYYDITNNSLHNLPSLPANITSGSYSVTFDSDGKLYVAAWPTSGTYQNTILQYSESTPTDLSGTWTGIYTYIHTSGVLDIEIDTNKNIFAKPNSGSVVVGTYVSGTTWTWESFSSSTSIDFGGKITTTTTTTTSNSTGGGDPHISPYYGKSYLLPNTASINMLLKSKDLKIKSKCWFVHPRKIEKEVRPIINRRKNKFTEMLYNKLCQSILKKNYFKYLQIQYKSINFIVDMDDLLFKTNINNLEKINNMETGFHVSKIIHEFHQKSGHPILRRNIIIQNDQHDLLVKLNRYPKDVLFRNNVEMVIQKNVHQYHGCFIRKNLNEYRNSENAEILRLSDDQ